METQDTPSTGQQEDWGAVIKMEIKEEENCRDDVLQDGDVSLNPSQPQSHEQLIDTEVKRIKKKRGVLRKKVATMEKHKWKCSTCKECFAHRRSLDRHIAVEHRPGALWECTQCCSVFNRRDNLLAHCRRRHPKCPIAECCRNSSNQAAVSTKTGARPRQERGSQGNVKEPRSHKGGLQLEKTKEVVWPHQGSQVHTLLDTVESMTRRGKELSRRRQAVPAQIKDTEEPSSGTDPERETRTVRVGKPVTELDHATILSGQHVRMGECSSRSVFRGPEKVVEDTTERQYDVVITQRPDEGQDEELVNICKITNGNEVGRQMSKRELERALIGNVKTITEKVTRSTYQGGAVIVREEVLRTYEVHLPVGVRDGCGCMKDIVGL